MTIKSTNNAFYKFGYGSQDIEKQLEEDIETKELLLFVLFIKEERVSIKS